LVSFKRPEVGSFSAYTDAPLGFNLPLLSTTEPGTASGAEIPEVEGAQGFRGGALANPALRPSCVRASCCCCCPRRCRHRHPSRCSAGLQGERLERVKLATETALMYKRRIPVLHACFMPLRLASSSPYGCAPDFAELRVHSSRSCSVAKGAPSRALSASSAPLSRSESVSEER